MNRMVLFMEGGLIHSAIADQEVQLLIVDTDLEGVDESEITHVPALETEVERGDVYLSGVVVNRDPELLEAIFRADHQRFESEPTTEEKAMELLRRLNRWQRAMGVWEAPVWRDLEQFLGEE